jgi:hypothetical protein
MSAISGGGNYVSDSAILEWVTVQQNRQYGELQDAMDFATLRGDMTSDFAKIKQELQAASKDPKALKQLNEDIQAFQDKYGDVPEFDDVTKMVGQWADEVSSKADALSGLAQAQADWDALPPPADGETDTRGDRPVAPDPLNADDVKDWAANADKVLDGTNQNEQLGMIRINEIKSTIDHTAEIASQLINSSNDTTAFAIHNFT